MDALTQAVSHFSAQLSDAAPGEKVRVAGIVTRVRPHQTKTGKSMGFVTLEDLQGNIELVVFPRTWDQYWEVFEVDSVVLVDGKVDAQGGDPKVLVDSVTTDLKTIVSSPPPGPNLTSSQPLPQVSAPAPGSAPFAPPPTEAPLPEDDNPAAPSNSAVTISKNEAQTSKPKRPNGTAATSSRGEPVGETPPPPDEFPPDWNALELAPGGFILEVGAKVADVTIADVAISEPVGAKVPDVVISEPAAVEPVREPTVVEGVEAPHASASGMDHHASALCADTGGYPSHSRCLACPHLPRARAPPESPVLATGISDITAAAPPQPSDPSKAGVPSTAGQPGTAVPPYILPPAEAYAGQALNMITVILRCGPDKVRDNLRLRQCYGILISYSGNDRFALQIFERNRGYRIEFPNYTTHFSSELIGRLGSIVGAENIIVESLRLH